MASLVVIAGANGSGKSTIYNMLCSKVKGFKSIPFINPDEIAKEISGSYINGNSRDNAKLMLKAGKEALTRRKELLSQKVNFGFETTLSGNSEINFIKKVSEAGYSVHMVYIGLDNPNLNVMRVRQRVASGGHSVEPETVIRRYERSIENIKEIIPYLSRLYLFDNSQDGHRLIFSGMNFGEGAIHNIYESRAKTEGWYMPIINEIEK